MIIVKMEWPVSGTQNEYPRIDVEDVQDGYYPPRIDVEDMQDGYYPFILAQTIK